jgi:glycosyltransferase involved in cell wall biosynthesis
MWWYNTCDRHRTFRVRAFDHSIRGDIELIMNPYPERVRTRSDELLPSSPLKYLSVRVDHTPKLKEFSGFPIVVHSHLRWSFVWQRPQQTHSRLARHHPILFLEEPVFADSGRTRLEISMPQENVWVGTPRLTSRDRVEEQVEGLVRQAAAGMLSKRFTGAVHWLYTPLMEQYIDAFPEPRGIIYDCMDELSNFAHASSKIGECERRLLARAHVVFAGGYELGEAKSRLHDNVHVFGCGVDFHHFHQAHFAECAADLRSIPSPRLGYIGVIDERLDYDLLRSLASAHPDASIVMIGPVLKVDPVLLPIMPNVYYLGARDYSVLPEYLAGIDVCLMPFALNDASRFINPTKTLEYLASGRPVISTPIRDVVRQFQDEVRICDASQFPEEVRRILAGDRPNPLAGLQRAHDSSWEETVARMELLAAQAARSAWDAEQDSRRVSGSDLT